MNIKKIAPIALYAAAFFLSSCASFSEFQDAKTLEPGQISGHLAVNTGKTGFDDNSSNINVPINPEFSIRAGLLSNLDIGATGYGSGAKGNLKLRLTEENREFVMALGLEAGYFAVQHCPASLEVNSVSACPAQEVGHYDFSLPIFFSFYPSEFIALTAAPALKYRSIDYKKDESLDYPDGLIFGTNLSIKIGQKQGMMGNIGYFYSPDQSATMFNAGIGFFQIIEI